MNTRKFYPGKHAIQIKFRKRCFKTLNSKYFINFTVYPTELGLFSYPIWFMAKKKKKKKKKRSLIEKG